MKGYNGRILRVDLTAGKVWTDEPSEDYYRKYVGGRGIIAHTLLTEVPKGIDPLGPDNRLVFSLGPITGHPLIGSGRNSIGAKSPLSGGFGETEVGGFWGAELKKCGYDAIIVEGVSPTPVFLWIGDGTAEIRDAGKLWGLGVLDTVKALQKQLGIDKIRTATIGPAGERMVRYACVLNDISHAAGRTGMGAVMGSKKLKAIAVKGKKLPEIADRKSLRELSHWMGRNFKEKARQAQYGTGPAMVKFVEVGNLPIRNFQGGPFPEVAKITPQVMCEKYLVKMEGCYGCPIRCKRSVKLEEPWEVDPIFGSPEYETLGAFGTNCGVDNLEALMRAHVLCNDYGIDTISAGVTVSFAMECFEKGILAPADTDGLELTFGNVPAMLELIERISFRQGFGDLLAEGSKSAAEKIGKGSEAFAIQVKGEEIPMHEPRYKQGMGLHYSIHATGADHASGIHDDRINMSEWERVDLSEPIPNTEMSPRKARMLYHVGLWAQIGNYLGLCGFIPYTHQQVRDAVEFVTGWPMSYWKLMKMVERGITLSRIFNIREGFSATDDKLPRRFFTSSADGPLKDIRIDPEKFAEAQRVYYQMLGWDESGVPTYGRLVELGIEWADDHLAGK